MTAHVFPPPPDSLQNGYLLLAQGHIDEALASLEQTEQQAPLHPQIQHALSLAYKAKGDEMRCVAAKIATLALTRGMPLVIYNLAAGYHQRGFLAWAEKWYRVTLMLDPELPCAHQNLANLLQANGRNEEARRHLDLAFSKQWFTCEASAAPAATVLLSCLSGIGNTPIDTLLPAERFTRIKYFVDYARSNQPAALDKLPDYQLIFNAIGDPDAIDEMDPRLLAILKHKHRVVLNPPEKIARTRRDRLPALLADIPDLVVPQVWRVSSQEAPPHSAVPAEAAYPLILRPACCHGGREVVLAEKAENLETFAFGETHTGYATEYHDYPSADGYYRKYRMIFVDRQPYPYHLAISRNWLVHYFSAEMLAEDWKVEEERRFLSDPEQALGARAWLAIRAAARRLDLDYAGMDFSLLPDGRVLVFEANANMLTHLEHEQGPLAHKNGSIQAIIDAYQRMIAQHAMPSALANTSPAKRASQ